MDYTKIYNNLINKAMSEDRMKSVDVYYEQHHIKMKSHGGTDEKDNLVLLTAREHFIAHLLLWKIYRDGPSAFAWWSMVRNNKNNSRSNKRYNISSRLYESARLVMSEKLRERKVSPEVRAKISENSARKGKPNWNTGIGWTKRNPKQTLDEDHRAKISAANKGKPKPTTECPHCGKVGGIPAMKRFHFDNCKEL